MSSHPRNLAETATDAGLIAIDEHRSAACLVHDRTQTGLSLTLLEGSEVPATFLLTLGTEIRVCRVVRRGEEEIEACFADLAVSATPIRATRTSLLRRRIPADLDLRRAA